MDDETKMLWDEEMRARALNIDLLSEEGRKSLEGQHDFGITAEVCVDLRVNSTHILWIYLCCNFD